MAGRRADTAYAGSTLEAAGEFSLLARQRAVCRCPYASLRDGLRIRPGGIDGRAQVGVAVPLLRKVGAQAVVCTASLCLKPLAYVRAYWYRAWRSPCLNLNQRAAAVAVASLDEIFEVRRQPQEHPTAGGEQ